MSDVARSVPSAANCLQPRRDGEGTLTHVVTVSVAGVELLGIRIRAALASFDTAARYGLDFPSGTNRDTLAWQKALEEKESCPQCSKVSPRSELLDEGCPWCGWRSARALRRDSGDDDPQLEGSGD
jgi:hypothetical protein